MENTQSVKTIQIEDLRQSLNWSKYLSSLGWKSYRTSQGINVEVMPFPLGSLIKVQRPKFLSEEAIKEIERIGVAYKAMFIKIEPLLGQDISVLENKGFVKSFSPLAPPSTIYMDLTLEESDLGRNISKTGRNSIKHSKGHTDFFKKPSEDKLKSFYEIAAESAKKQKFMIQSFNDLKKKVEVFGDESFLALGYNENNKLTGGKFFLAYKDSIWYLHAGTNELGWQSNCGDKMMWDSLMYFKNLGYKTMDLDGIDDPRFPNFTKNWGGFSFFKEKFGGETIRFPHSYIKYYNPVFKFLSKFKVFPL